jgi:hypothetical protein
MSSDVPLSQRNLIGDDFGLPSRNPYDERSSNNSNVDSGNNHFQNSLQTPQKISEYLAGVFASTTAVEKLKSQTRGSSPETDVQGNLKNILRNPKYSKINKISLNERKGSKSTDDLEPPTAPRKPNSNKFSGIEEVEGEDYNTPMAKMTPAITRKSTEIIPKEFLLVGDRKASVVGVRGKGSEGSHRGIEGKG